MDLLGTLTRSDESYVIAMRDNKTNNVLSIFSHYHRDDRLAMSQGKVPVHPRFGVENVKAIDNVEDYLIGILHRTKSTGVIKTLGQPFILTNMLTDLGLLQVYKFAEEDVLVDTYSKEEVSTLHQFEAQFDDTYFSYTKENDIFTRLEFVYNGTELRLLPGKFPLVMTQFSSRLVEMTRDRTKVLNDSLLNSMDYRTMKANIDLSWFEDPITEKRHKDYISIHNKLDFEELVINDMKNELIRCRLMGELFDLAFDTETTGFIFMNLKRDNPVLDKMVAISMSWRADFAAVIFIDMEYFDNVDLEYVVGRLKPFLERDDLETPDIEYPVFVKKNENGSSTSTNSFGMNTRKDGSVIIEDLGDNSSLFDGYERDMFTFNREEICVVAHNGPFDGKVMYHYGCKIYFDMDTLQLAFNLNPKLGKGKNKLENLLEKVFGITVPSLSLVLGKGNEGSYRFIKDEVVALIYGGSDTDNLRSLHKYLKSIAGKVYKMTQVQDIYLLNKLYISEYNGLRIDKEAFIKEASIIEARKTFLENWLYDYVGEYIKNKNIEQMCIMKFSQGASKEEVQKFYNEKMATEKAKRYIFDLSGEKLRNVMFNILEYPKLKRGKASKTYPEGVPSIDKVVVEQWMKSKLPKPSKLMSRDLVHPDELGPSGEPIRKDAVLVEAKKINACEFPVAFILKKYAELKKEYDSYFGPYLKEDFENIISRGFSMSRIETRRIMNPLQTMKARLKKYILPYGKDWYMVVFDQSQVEPRIMMSLAKAVKLINDFMDPEKDYHTENASNIQGIEPHTLESEIRGIFKAITLGLPYGLGVMKMCMSIFKELTDGNIIKTRAAIVEWKRANAEIWAKLEEFRKQGLEKVDIAEGLREFITKMNEAEPDTFYGKAANLIGFYRLFDLTDYLDGSVEDADGKIMRPAGNYPIQSFAAELFRIIIKRLLMSLKADGLEDNVLLHMLVHDEGVMSAHKSVHPIRILKHIYESCVVRLEGHTTYFVGVNIGENWGDGKDDNMECPVKFVEEVIPKWDAGEFREDDYWNWTYTFRNSKNDLVTYNGPKAYIYELKQQFMVRRIKEVIEAYMPSISKTRTLDVRELLPIFSNYIVRAYVTSFFPSNFHAKEIPGEAEIDFKNRQYTSHLESWILDAYGEGFVITDSDGETREVVARDFSKKEDKSPKVIDLDLNLLDDIEDDKTKALQEEESYYSFDTVEVYTYDHDMYMSDEDLSDDQYIDKYYNRVVDNKGRARLQYKSKKKYVYLKEMPTQILIKANREERARLKAELTSRIGNSSGGKTLMFDGLSLERWVKVPKEMDLRELDELIGEVLGSGSG